MKQAIFKLTQAQGYFLEALDEEEHAICSKTIFNEFKSRRQTIGEDDMEKFLKRVMNGKL